MRPVRIEFLCLGNICRSPLAEGVFRHLVAQAGLADHFEIASAGTGGWHVGDPPDARTIAVARQHGVDLSAQRGRVFNPAHLTHYDEIFAMDLKNLAHLERFSKPGQRARTGLLMDVLGPQATVREVPDPYTGGPADFETVYTLVHAACVALLARSRPG